MRDLPGRILSGAPGAALIGLDRVSVALDGHPILDSIDMQVRRGEIVTIVGPNGSGKSTLIRTIIGLLPATSGTIRRAAGLTIGYVPQRLAIDPSMPVTVGRFMNLPRRRPAAAVAAALAEAGLPGVERRQIAGLSGGQLQRVLLARALLDKPDLLILDEATAGLDQPGVAAFYARIEQVRARHGCAVLMVSHDLQIVMRASDHVICLNGHVCCEGTPEKVSLSPAYHSLFGMAGAETLALYRHHHTHSHDEDGGGESGGESGLESGRADRAGCGHDHGPHGPAEPARARDHA